jgi:hypothetical protein
LNFEAGVGRLDRWWVAEPPQNGKIDRVKGPDGLLSLHITTLDDTAAAWRTKALIQRGHYRFEGRVRIASVQPLPYGVHHGAGLRVRGKTRQEDSFTGDSPWRVLATDFQVEQAAEEVEFICELRARSGEVWFELNSLQVVQVGDL